MRTASLDQRTRLIILVVEAAILCFASFLAFGTVLPPTNDKGFWFYTALVGLMFGSRLDTPFFARPADVILYALPLVIGLYLANSWRTWTSGQRVAYLCTLAFCPVSALIAAAAILSKDAKTESGQQFSNVMRVLAQTLGLPRVIFSIVVAFADYAYHSDSVREILVIAVAWATTGALSPIEGIFRLWQRVRVVMCPLTILGKHGEIAAFQTPGIILLRQGRSQLLAPGDLLGINDSLGNARVALALDYVGRDEGMLVRAIQVAEISLRFELAEQVAYLPLNTAAVRPPKSVDSQNCFLLANKSFLIGIVAADIIHR